MDNKSFLSDEKLDGTKVTIREGRERRTFFVYGAGIVEIESNLRQAFNSANGESQETEKAEPRAKRAYTRKAKVWPGNDDDQAQSRSQREKELAAA